MCKKQILFTFLRPAITLSKKLLDFEEPTSELVFCFLDGGELSAILMLPYKK